MSLLNVRDAFRSLSRKPSFVVPAVLALALGTGGAITLFSLVHAVFLAPLPYPEPDELVWLRERHADVPARPVSYPTFLDWQARNASFDAMAAVRNARRTLTTQGEARALDIAMVAADYFEVIGVPPRIGRDFTDAENVFGAARVAIVSERLRQAALGGRADPAGATLTLDDASYTVIGVAPPDLSVPGDPDAWILMGQHAVPESGWTGRSNRIAGFVVARLKLDVDIDDARADMARVQAQLAREYPVHVAGNEVEMLTLREALSGDLRLPLTLSLGAVGVLLSIVCVNLSNLLLVRAIGRRSELAVRTALGASRGTLLARSLTESLAIAVLGTVLGLAGAHFGTELLASSLAAHLADGTTVEVGLASFGFALALAVLMSVAIGVVPAMRTFSDDLRPALGDNARTTERPAKARARSVFLLFQTALTVVLLVGAALLVASMARLLASDPGFRKESVLTFRLLLPSEYRDAQRLTALYARLESGLGALPGVRAASVVSNLPGLAPTWQTDIAPDLRGEPLRRAPGELINVDWGIVSADYFETMGIALLRGRGFTAQEAERGAPVVVVDESLARRFWPDGDAIGSRLRYDGPEPVTIVGVAANVHTWGSEEAGLITLYTPYGRFPFLGSPTVAIRTDGVEPLGRVPAVRDIIRG